MDDPKLMLQVASLPNADKFQLHIYAALAEQEREFISQRTKAALAQAKKRGVKLGGYREGLKKHHEANTAKANENAEQLRNVIEPMVFQQQSMRSIAAALNKAGIKTARGNDWHPQQVSRVIDRLGLRESD